MVGGVFGNLKIGAIIQARYDSNRFPGKVLRRLPFDSEETILSQIVNRLKKNQFLDSIIIATSEEQSDNLIFDYCIKNGIHCERGSKNDVLDRFAYVASKNNLDIIIRITGDNPIVFNDLLVQVLTQHIQGDYHYSRNNNLPYGTSFEIINSTVILDINKLEIPKTIREHVTLFIKNNINDYKVLEFDHNLEKLDFRFTIDYPEDYATMNIIFQFLRASNYKYDFNFLNNFIKENLWLYSINGNKIQKRTTLTLEEELKEVKTILKQLEFNQVIELLNIK